MTSLRSLALAREFIVLGPLFFGSALAHGATGDLTCEPTGSSIQKVAVQSSESSVTLSIETRGDRSNAFINALRAYPDIDAFAFNPAHTYKFTVGWSQNAGSRCVNSAEAGAGLGSAMTCQGFNSTVVEDLNDHRTVEYCGDLATAIAADGSSVTLTVDGAAQTLPIATPCAFVP